MHTGMLAGMFMTMSKRYGASVLTMLHELMFVVLHFYNTV